MFITLTSTTTADPQLTSFLATEDQGRIAEHIEGISDVDLYGFDGDAFDADVAGLAREVRSQLDSGGLDPSTLEHFTDALGISITA